MIGNIKMNKENKNYIHKYVNISLIYSFLELICGLLAIIYFFNNQDYIFALVFFIIGIMIKYNHIYFDNQFINELRKRKY